MIVVRAAKPGDGTLLLKTTQALAVFYGFTNGVKAQASDFEAALFCVDPVIGALIAEDDGIVAGAVVWHRSFSIFLGSKTMYLEAISVLPEFRRRGIGKALMQATAQLAIVRGYKGILWLVIPTNENAKKFYSQCGADFEQEHQVCHISGEALRKLAT
jgi:ribosomal protein S18 acetylase RimI-like enzyme